MSQAESPRAESPRAEPPKAESDDEEQVSVELIGTHGTHKRVRINVYEPMREMVQREMPGEEVSLLLPLTREHMRDWIWDWVQEQMDAKSDIASQNISFRDIPEGELHHYTLTMKKITRE